jgi:hypothetical protein
VVMELEKDRLQFNAVATDGRVVDSGDIARVEAKPAATRDPAVQGR